VGLGSLHVPSFFFWGRYLRFCPFVDCIGKYFFKSIFFLTIFLYKKFICVIFLLYVYFGFIFVEIL